MGLNWAGAAPLAARGFRQCVARKLAVASGAVETAETGGDPDLEAESQPVGTSNKRLSSKYPPR